MRKGLAAVLCLALPVVMAGVAQAAPIVVDGTIGPVYDAEGNWLGTSIDSIVIDVTANTLVTFDGLAFEHDFVNDVDVDVNGDGEITTLDLEIVLQDSGGNRLAEADDAVLPEGSGDGSISPADPYLQYMFTTAGTYTLFASGFAMSDYEIESGYNFENQGEGDYRITITALRGSVSLHEPEKGVVPEPATVALFGMGLGGFALRRLRLRS